MKTTWSASGRGTSSPREPGPLVEVARSALGIPADDSARCLTRSSSHSAQPRPLRWTSRRATVQQASPARPRCHRQCQRPLRKASIAPSTSRTPSIALSLSYDAEIDSQVAVRSVRTCVWTSTPRLTPRVGVEQSRRTRPARDFRGEFERGGAVARGDRTACEDRSESLSESATTQDGDARTVRGAGGTVFRGSIVFVALHAPNQRAALSSTCAGVTSPTMTSVACAGANIWSCRSCAVSCEIGTAFGRRPV